MTRKTRATTVDGKRISLSTDDTLTLAFPGMHESTAWGLAHRISEKSLREIAQNSEDSNEREKALRALLLLGIGADQDDIADAEAGDLAQ